MLTERHGASESPDAIGWKNHGWSILVECKVSRADFLADLKKPHRVNPDGGMGQTRYFLTPPGLLKVDELPATWGLLEVRGRFVRVVHEPEKRGSLSLERCRHELPILYAEVWRDQNGVDSRMERETAKLSARIEDLELRAIEAAHEIREARSKWEAGEERDGGLAHILGRVAARLESGIAVEEDARG